MTATRPEDNPETKELHTPARVNIVLLQTKQEHKAFCLERKLFRTKAETIKYKN